MPLCRKIVVLTIVLVLGSGAAAVAQTDSDWIEVRVIRVKADKVDAWRDLQKNVVNPALREGGTPWRTAWVSVLGNSYEWVFVSPIPKMSQYDQEGRVTVSPEASEKLSECHAGREVHAHLRQRELSRALTSMPPPSTAIVTSFQIAPGRVDEYRELAKDYILPAMAKIESPGYEVYRSIFGGEDRWFTVRFADGVGEIDHGPSLRRGLDPSTYALVSQKLNDLQMNVERVVQRLDPDLSYYADTASNED